MGRGNNDQILVLIRSGSGSRNFLKEYYDCGIGDGKVFLSCVRKQSDNTRANGPQIERIKSSLNSFDLRLRWRRFAISECFILLLLSVYMLI